MERGGACDTCVVTEAGMVNGEEYASGFTGFMPRLKACSVSDLIVNCHPLFTPGSVVRCADVQSFK